MKTLKRIIAILMCAIMILPVAACTSQPQHEHFNSEITEIIPSTCVTQGKAKAKCSCGEEFEVDMPLDPENHEQIITLEAVEPTYETPGKTEGKKCSACGVITVAQEEVEYGFSRTVVKMWGYGDSAEQELYNMLVEHFNASEYAKYHGISLRLSWYGKDLYNQTVNNGSTAQSGKVDVIMTSDGNFRKWVNEGYIDNLDSYTGDGQFDQSLEKIYGGISSRYRHNPVGNTSYGDDPLWGVPVDASASALYYNKSALENTGVIVISVDNDTVTSGNYAAYSALYEGLSEEHIGSHLMELWNQNKIADKSGQYHDSCGLRAGYAQDVLKAKSITVPKKGYYREDSENIYDGKPTTVWINPNKNGVNEVVKVFNASIAMSWDELEDVAHLMTADHNSVNHGRTPGGKSVSTEHGVYISDIESLLASVSPSVLSDVSGEGTWMPLLADWSSNYIVTKAGDGYIGKVTGKTYREGEALEFMDKINVSGYASASGEVIVPLADGGVGIYDKETGSVTALGSRGEADTSDSVIADEVKQNAVKDKNQKLDSGKDALFVELPSNREMTARYMQALFGNGKQIMPWGSNYEIETRIFTACHVAFWEGQYRHCDEVELFADDISLEWGVAPMPVFKQYVSPESDTVAREGLRGGISYTKALSIATGSTHKDLAWRVIEWMTGDAVTVAGTEEHAGQYYKAAEGYTFNQSSLFCQNGLSSIDGQRKNLDLFVSELEHQAAPLEWYMPSTHWSHIVYGGGASGTLPPSIADIDTMLKSYTLPASKELIQYSYFSGDESFQKLWTDYFGV